MAGPMVGPMLERLAGLDLVRTYWEPDGEFPDHEPNPLLEENRALHHRQGRATRAPTSASPGTATPTAASSSTRPARFVDGDFLTALLAESMLAQAPGRRRSSTTCAPRARCRTPSRPPAARALVNRVGHAFFKTRMRDEGGVFGGEVSGHYYFADFYNADSGTIPALLILELLGQRGHDAVRAARALPLAATSSPARSTPRSPTRRRRWREIERALRRRATSASSTASRSTTTTGTSTCARRTPSRCCACASSGSSPQRGHGAPARRGAGA